MADAATVPERMTVAEFLSWSPGGDTRYELVEGQPVMMNPPKVRHLVIESNLTRLISPLLGETCSLLGGAGVVVDDRADTYLEADLALTCEVFAADQQHLREPSLIIEVLSPSNRAHDLGLKLPRYWDLPSVREILYISSTERSVRHWRRDGDQWVMTTVIGKGSIALATVGTKLDLDEIYRRVVF